VPFTRPTLAELATRTRADMESRLGGDPFLPRSFEYILARTLAGLAHGQHGHIGWAAKQIVPGRHCDDDTILEWAGLFLDPPRKAATVAVGPAVTFTGTDTTVIPAGTQVQLSDGTTFTVDADGTITGGSATVAITAEEAGAQGNAAAGAKVSLSSPIIGVDSEGVADEDIAGGADLESIADVFARLALRLSKPPRAGGDGDFVRWMLDTPAVAVVKAWEWPKYNGPGTVRIAFLTDSGIPSAAEADAVLAYVVSKAPTFMLSVDMTVPADVPLVLSIQLSPNTAAVRAAVLAEIEDLIDREAIPDGVLPLSHIKEAISTATGEEDHALVSPVADVDPGVGNILTFDAGSVSFSTL